MSYFASWQEQQEMDLAIAMSMQQSSQDNCLLTDGITDEQQQQQQQWVSVSTIYGNLIRVPVHPGMPILDFKAKCLEADLWDGCPIGFCTPLAINVDLVDMMSEGRHLSVTDPEPWQTDGRYNRLRLCTNAGQLLDDEGVLQQDVLTDCTLFKVQWMKQFKFRLQEIAMLQHFGHNPTCGNMAVGVNNNTTFIAYPFYGNEGQLYGLVYQHNDTQGHSEVHQVAQVSPMNRHLPAVRASFGANGQLNNVTIMPGIAQSQ